jgi:hypothetical protein
MVHSHVSNLYNRQCDEDEARWDKRLNKVAKQKPGKSGSVRLCAVAITATLAACALPPPPLRHDLIVEGGAESYPAFEAAAKVCGFTALKRVSDGSGGTHINLYNIYPITRAGRCAMQWIDDHPDSGLVLSAH